MCTKKNFFQSVRLVLVSIVITIVILAIPSRIYAQESTLFTENGTCASCHEDLYFLHDTGNWFCIREAPMSCVDCHGGDPYAFKQEDAHASRKIHPIINEDVSKCQECHPAECDERVVKFDQVAGISDILIVAPYQPKQNLLANEVQATSFTEPVLHPVQVSYIEITVLVLITGLALAIYFVHKVQHKQK